MRQPARDGINAYASRQPINTKPYKSKRDRAAWLIGWTAEKIRQNPTITEAIQMNTKTNIDQNVDGQFTEAHIEIYDELKATGVEIANHESDLYVPVTPLTRAIVDRYQFCRNVKTFTDEVTGQPWFDIPFAYVPFWEAKAKGHNSTRVGTCYFRSHVDAVAYYHAQHDMSLQEVNQKLAAQEIHIGEPPLKAGQRCYADREGRYWIEGG